MALIFCFMYFFSSYLLNEVDESLTTGAFFAIIPTFIIIVWLFTKLLGIIVHHISFMYWLFCLGLGFVTLHISLNKPINITTAFLHFSVLMFLIPEMRALLITYINTKTVYSKGKVVSRTQWTTDSYFYGSLRKLLLMALLAAIFYVLNVFVGVSGVWIVFIVETIFTGALIILNTLAYFKVIG